MVDAEEIKGSVRENFCSRLKSLREEIGISQAEFAKELGVSRATIGYYESTDKQNQRLPDIAFLAALMKKTGCSAEYFLFGDNKVMPSSKLFDNNNITDKQYSILMNLFTFRSFWEFLSSSEVLNVFNDIDRFADYKLGVWGEDFLAAIVEQHAAAQFGVLANMMYRKVDANERLEHEFFLEEILEDDYLKAEKEKDSAFVKLMKEYMSCWHELIKISDTLEGSINSHMDAVHKSVEHVRMYHDDKPKSKLDTFREKMITMSKGLPEEVSSRNKINTK